MSIKFGITKGTISDYAGFRVKLLFNGVEAQPPAGSAFTFEGLTFQINPTTQSIREDCIEVKSLGIIMAHNEQESDWLVKMKEKLPHVLKQMTNLKHADSCFDLVDLVSGKKYQPYQVLYEFIEPTYNRFVYFDCDAELKPMVGTSSDGKFVVTSCKRKYLSVEVYTLPFRENVYAQFSDEHIKEAFLDLGRKLLKEKTATPLEGFIQTYD